MKGVSPVHAQRGRGVALARTKPIDVYCMGCGYNLRGQAGDPRRCPECGQVNRLDDLLVPADLINKQLRRLETGPGLCVAAVAGLAFWLLPVLSVMLHGAVSPPPVAVWVAEITMIVIAVGMWIVGLLMYRSSCRGQTGWVWTLFVFHVWGILVAALALGGAGSIMISWGSFGLPAPRVLWWPQAPDELWSLLVSGIGLGAFAAGAPWAYRRAKSAVRPLQRRVAAQLARDRCATTAGAVPGSQPTSRVPPAEETGGGFGAD